MKVEKEVTIPERKETVVDYYLCEFCKKKINEYPKSYERQEVEVVCEKGYSYPESSWGEKTVLDICYDCFFQKLMPWAYSQGASVRTEEWDY